MLRLNHGQLKSLSEARALGFEQRMQEHLRVFFAERYRQTGDNGVLAIIKHGIVRAAAYQITTERDVCKYIDLMFCFGLDYDRDPKLPWVAHILNSPLLASPGGKIDVVFAAALEYLNKTADVNLTVCTKQGGFP